MLRSLSICLALVAGCAASDAHPPPIAGEVDDGGAGALPRNPCAGGAAEEGCPCFDRDATADCMAERRSGTYVSCGPGTRYCGDAGRWGECIGPTVYEGP